MKEIAIIGGGLSGTLLAMNLLAQAVSDDEVKIILFERSAEGTLGPAYSSNEECLLLNVPACKMGAYSKEEDHFLKWARTKRIDANEWDFLPRKLYREYILELFRKAIRKKKKNVLIERIEGEVTDIRMKERKAEIFVNEKGFVTDKAVLALGNFPPRNLPVKNRSFLQSKCYIQNPWSDSIFNTLAPGETVILIGTGQTTVDMLQRLHARNHKGKIISISRHGLFPLAHSSFEEYPSFYREIKNQYHVVNILNIARKHFTIARSKGISINAVMDSLRPYTQELWKNLPTREKASFLRHLFRYYEIIRSRIPKKSNDIANQLRMSGQLKIIKGKITDIIPGNNHIQVHYKTEGTVQTKTEPASLLVNCIGPETDYAKIEHPLIKNLLNRGLIQPDELHQGINALPDGAILDADGTPHRVLYTLGFPLRGILWEVLAAPEIRLQAEQLAALLLSFDKTEQHN